MIKKFIIPAFVLLVAAQLYVPASMIMDREQVIADGEVFLFATQPLDPRDPFRGQYINLNFEEDSYVPSDVNLFKAGQEIYVHIEKNENDIANVVGLSAKEPTSGYYLLARISHIQNDRIFIEYPFERFYMEETKAPQAEKVIRQARDVELQLAYAKVYILQGKSVLEDVMINGKSLKDITHE